MTSFDDKTLVAFVDGELDVSEAHEVDTALRHDVALREKVRLMRESAVILRAAFAEVFEEPIPPRLVRSVDGAEVSAATANGRVEPARPARRYRGPLAAAGAIVFMLGLGGGYVAAGYRLHSERSLDQRLAAREHDEVDRLVQVTLEKKLSGSEAQWRNPDTGETVVIEPIRTFKNQDGRYCREYREETIERAGSKHVQYGMACRRADGAWRVRYYLVPGDDPPDMFRN